MATARRKRATTPTAEAGGGGQQRRPGRKLVPRNETRHDKFVRLATYRVGLVLNAIRLVGQLSGVNYVFSPDEVDKIEATLQQAVSDEMRRLRDRLGIVPRATFQL